MSPLDTVIKGRIIAGPSDRSAKLRRPIGCLGIAGLSLALDLVQLFEKCTDHGKCRAQSEILGESDYLGVPQSFSTVFFLGSVEGSEGLSHRIKTS